MLSLRQRCWLAFAGAIVIVAGVSLAARSWYRSFPMVPVLKAARDIPAGEAIDESAVSVAQVPAGSRAPGALTAVDQVRGRWTADTIYAGEFVTARRVTDRPPDPYATDTGEGRGLLSLPVSPARVLGGVLQPGDTVTIYTVAGTGEATAHTSLAAADVPVVDVRNTAAAPASAKEEKDSGLSNLGGASDANPAWVIVRVTPDEATRLMEAVESHAAVYFFLTERRQTAWAGGW